MRHVFQFDPCVIAVVTFLLLGGYISLVAQEPDYVKAVEEGAQTIEVTLDGQTPLKRIVAYKWANAASPQQVGQLHLFVQDDQRPVASAKIGPTVAQSRERRLTEAKMLARRFTAQVDQDTAIHASSNREQRLLPTPIYRYGSQDYSKDGTVDGVLFVFTVEGGNPTTFLHLEVYRQKESTGWQYAISRRGVSGLEVTYDGVKVWELPRIGSSSPLEILYRISDPR